MAWKSPHLVGEDVFQLVPKPVPTTKCNRSECKDVSFLPGSLEKWSNLTLPMSLKKSGSVQPPTNIERPISIGIVPFQLPSVLAWKSRAQPWKDDWKMPPFLLRFGLFSGDAKNSFLGVDRFFLDISLCGPAYFQFELLVLGSFHHPWETMQKSFLVDHPRTCKSDRFIIVP